MTEKSKGSILLLRESRTSFDELGITDAHSYDELLRGYRFTISTLDSKLAPSIITESDIAIIEPSIFASQETIAKAGKYLEDIKKISSRLETMLIVSEFDFLYEDLEGNKLKETFCKYGTYVIVKPMNSSKSEFRATLDALLRLSEDKKVKPCIAVRYPKNKDSPQHPKLAEFEEYISRHIKKIDGTYIKPNKKYKANFKCLDQNASATIRKKQLELFTSRETFLEVIPRSKKELPIVLSELIYIKGLLIEEDIIKFALETRQFQKK